MSTARDSTSNGSAAGAEEGSARIARAAELIRPVAQNLRAHRRQRGFSLSALARAAGISKSTLSDLERGRGNPSIDTLWALAQALSLPFAALFEENRERSVNVIRFDHSPVVAVEGSGFRTRHLMSRHDQGAVELYLLDLDAGTRRDAVAHSPGVIEHVVVMSGRIDVGPEGQSELLGPGDYMQFPADVPHHYHAIDGTVCLLSLHCY
jgi:transcriptional regulator with XRE-family HTH domain